MKRFGVRVELLNEPTAADYHHLHERLMVAEFINIVVADDGGKWRLPPAEYVHASESTVRAVRELLNSVIQRGLQPGLGYRTFVTEFVDWASENLVKV